MQYACRYINEIIKHCLIQLSQRDLFNMLCKDNCFVYDSYLFYLYFTFNGRDFLLLLSLDYF